MTDKNFTIDLTGKSEAYKAAFKRVLAELEVQERHRKAGQQLPAPTVRNDVASASARHMRTGTGEMIEFRAAAAATPPPPPPGRSAAMSRREALRRDGMDIAQVNHRLGKADAPMRADAEAVADVEAAAADMRVRLDSTLRSDAAREAARRADAERRVDDALRSINRPAAPPPSRQPARPYQQPAASSARARMQVRADLVNHGIPIPTEMRQDQSPDRSLSASEARRRLFNSGN